MSKKNRHNNPWPVRKPAGHPIAHSEPAASATVSMGPAATGVTQASSLPSDFSPISPAQLAANRANAQLSTGPRTPAGLQKSSRNAVKSALTGRTVLLPSDDVQEYAAFLAQFHADLAPVGALESELVQIIVDCHWRLRRIQELEYALYNHGHRQFEAAFADEPEQDRHSLIVLQTHLTYKKELRNFEIQERRLDRKRSQAKAELERLQSERKRAAESPALADSPFDTEAELFAALDAGYIPPHLAAHLAQTNSVHENGFEFSNFEKLGAADLTALAEPTFEPSQAA